MKRNFNLHDVAQKEGQDQSKKIYRSITELAKRLDDARGCSQKVVDLFTPYLHIQRRKFREYCERLIFLDPVLYGHKGEELLWKKSYYDIVSTAKKLKKQEYSPEEIAKIEAHINAGIGYYNHFISKLHSEYDLNLYGYVDFITQTENTAKVDKSKSENLMEWAKQCVHRCLIYLGDLCRYKLEIYPNWDSNLAIRYYSQALYFNPDFGMPHNQLGTLASTQNRMLDAIYHYMRCLDSRISFDGTENNLQRLFEKNSHYLEKLPNKTQNSDCIVQPEKTENVRQFLARFFLLIDIWYFNKTVPHIYNLCHQTYIDLEECLTYYKSVSSESGDTQTELDSADTDTSLIQNNLDSDALFKMVVMCLLCISKLQKMHSNHLSTAIAFTLAIYSQFIHYVTDHLQRGILSFPLTDLPNEDDTTQKKKSKKKLQLRRRRKSVGGSDESELSENENEGLEYSSNESVISDDEIPLALSSDEETEVDKSGESINDSLSNSVGLNGKEEKNDSEPSIDNKTVEVMMRKLKRIDTNDKLEIISEIGLLHCIKAINDWLSSDLEVLKSCCRTSRRLLKQIINLLNMLNIDFTNIKLDDVKDVHTIWSNFEYIPLPEDVVLKGVQIFSRAHKNINWKYFHKKSMLPKQEVVLRILKILSFGKQLQSLNETGITYDEKSKMYTCSIEEDDENDITINFEELEKQTPENGECDRKNIKDMEPKGQLNKMKHMGQLWLAAEVRALESRVKGKASLSPYLVVDVDVLIKYTYMAKHLVSSRKFIIIVPSAVVSALDDLKREKIEARDAIRWLESQFHQGNRFFRAQRPHERTPLPFIKYPKKKDKQAFIYIQIIECCHYLAQQQKGASDLVTLLIGNQNVLSNGENREISYLGLAESAGVQLESITQFYNKWKKTGKTKR